MPNCIAIDASSEACSAFLMAHGRTASASTTSPKTHSRFLLPFVNDLLTQHSVTLADMDFIACSQGPGSFTGLRIGLGIAQGLAFGAGKPMVGVGSLSAMAYGAQQCHPEAEIIITVLDARMGEIYWSATHVFGQELRQIVEPSLDSLKDLEFRLGVLANQNSGKRLLLAGPACHLLDQDLLQRIGVGVDDSVVPNAEQIATLAAGLWQRGIFCTPQDFQLNYIRNSVSWNKRQRIRT